VKSNARVSLTGANIFGHTMPERTEIAAYAALSPTLARTRPDWSMNITIWRATEHKAIRYSRC